MEKNTFFTGTLFIIAGTAVTGLLSAQTLFAGTNFSDIAASRYRTSIEFVADRKAVGGYPNGTFQPKRVLNRAELATILVSTDVPFEEIKDKKNCFKDVHDEWFAPFVCYAKERGVVGGYADGNFRPGQEVKMAEAYLMGIKDFGFTTIKPVQGDPWYKASMDFIHVNGIFSKFGFLPAKQMTREEMAWLLHQFFLIKDGTKEILSKRENFSLGCGKIPPKTPPVSSLINAVSRSYITAIPAGYDKNTPTKLVFAFHGRTNSNAEVRKYYGVEQAAASSGSASDKAIFIYPAGIRNSGGFTWSSPGDKAAALRDFRLFDQLLEEFSSKYCINLDEVFVVGHSLGAWFTNSLACARGEVIRGVASVAGGTTIANCTGPVAAFIMHNAKDNLVPFSQGVQERDQLVKQNQCSAKSLSTEPKRLYCKAYQGCGDFAPLTWCEHQDNYAYWDGSYYPHTWPKGTGKEIWSFFESLED